MNPYIFLATPMYAGQCTGGYAVSMMKATPVFMNARLPFQFAFTVNESLISRARDSLAYDFLQTECTHLMFIDSDIEFNPEDILSMLEHDKDILCGVYPRKQINWERVHDAAQCGEPPEDLHRYTGLFVVNTLDGAPIEDADGRWPVEVASGGCGFMLIRREVFERLAERVPQYQSPLRVGEPGAPKVYRQFFDSSIDPATGYLLSEDFHFCRLARANRFSVWAAPWVTLTHAGSYNFTGRIRP